jgi:hypothetical protein
MTQVKVNASYYQQFDADYALDVPAEGYGGWKTGEVEIDPAHTAVVVMHAWETGTYAQFPGWYRAVEYIPRARSILRTVFPRLLSAVRASGIRLFHVVGGGDYYQGYPGYDWAVRLAGPQPPLEKIASDPILDQLKVFRKRRVFVGQGNEADVARGSKEVLGFAPEARPVGGEGIAKNAHQLFALCKSESINHLVYVGFAINWCLLMSPGGMVDMSRRGVMCSTIRQAVTAVENRETARLELNKGEALWRVAVGFGFVFDSDDFLQAISVS